MKYLFSVEPEIVANDDKDRWAPTGEPVVPWYPATLENVFLSTVSFKQAPVARVIDDDEIDIDSVAVSLYKHLPGLPKTLHNNYVLAVARAAHALPEGTRLQAFIDNDTAKLKILGQENYIVLWESQPLT